MFQVDIILQFHPIYSTEKDKVFKVQCFYNDESADEIDWQLIKDHTQRKIKFYFINNLIINIKNDILIVKYFFIYHLNLKIIK